MKYIARAYTGSLKPGDILTEEQAREYGEAKITDLLRRGAIRAVSMESDTAEAGAETGKSAGSEPKAEQEPEEARKPGNADGEQPDGGDSADGDGADGDGADGESEEALPELGDADALITEGEPEEKAEAEAEADKAKAKKSARKTSGRRK